MPRPKKCSEFETDLGEIAVRQPSIRRSHKINMSREMRSYICLYVHDERWPVVRPVLIAACTMRA